MSFSGRHDGATERACYYCWLSRSDFKANEMALETKSQTR